MDLSITLATASILGLILLWLSSRVIGGRVQGEVLIGDGDDQALIFKIRSHANFTEYVPIFLIILAGLELSGGHRLALIVIAAVFVVSRLLHVAGMGPDANLKPRQAGTIGSFTCIGTASLYGLYLGLMG
ncbi:MAG: MAPEG family protein [Pseudomonadota bacterium]